MGRSQETFSKKEVRNKKEKKRKEKEAKKLARRETETKGTLNDMMAYVDEFGNITDTPPDPTKKKVEINLEDIEITVPKGEDMEEVDLVRKGVVTFYNDAKGFGFIKDSVTSESIFVHINNSEDELKENNMVIFEVERGLKGLTAVNVKLDK
ncbi:MAG: cold shock CspA family protein [Bacteroidia bacterium]|jgi:cold shock CspA family protein